MRRTKIKLIPTLVLFTLTGLLAFYLPIPTLTSFTTTSGSDWISSDT
ncbi:hypothetical protein [Leptolyngbya sp. 'hensonii']|nr:hypothetical protein [Leptolyngbya sp. 'hensonii']